MKKIIIIDYGSSNLKSIEAAFNYLGYSTMITRDKKKIINSNSLVLPGVGSFPVVKKYLDQEGISNSIVEYINHKRPFLGICLGMQLLFDISYEFKKTKGLGIIKGEVRNLKEEIDKKKFSVPNTGWIELKRNKLFKKKNIIEFNKNMNFFFTHSYFAKPKDNSIISSYIKFNKKLICSSVQYKNIYGMQFHPEKSGKKGLEVLKNFCKL